MEAEERPAKIRRLNSPANGEDTDPRHGNDASPTTKLNCPAVDRDEKQEPPESNDVYNVKTASADDRTEDGASQDVLEVMRSLETTGEQQPTPPMSKNQLKKLKRKEKWEAGREVRKKERKERKKEKKERYRAEKQNKSTPEGAVTAVNYTPRQPIRHVQLPITIVLDCGFNELMTEKELISLGSQLTRSYSDNSKAPFRVHLALSSFEGLLKKRFDEVLGGTHKRWKGTRISGKDFVHVSDEAKEWMTRKSGGELAGAFSDANCGPESGETVYLTADCETTLTELKPYSTYIIGGLVDRNRHKSVCYRRAVERGIKTAKLPIGAYLQMSSRQVLATNHVNEIMLRWLELGDWGEAFMKVIPKRKGGTLKATQAGNGTGLTSANDTNEDRVDDGSEHASDAQSQAEDNDRSGDDTGDEDYAAGSVHDGQPIDVQLAESRAAAKAQS